MTLAKAEVQSASGPIFMSRSADYFLLCIASAVTVGVIAGFLTSLGGVVKDVRALTLPFFAAALILVAVAVSAGSLVCLRSAGRIRDSLFIASLAALWLLSRLAVVLAFPGAVLVGDEVDLHRFVLALRSGGFGSAHLAQMSSSYDFPVWLARAFPIYYPFRVLFGDLDIFAVRLLNVALSAATLVLAFLVVRRLCGSPVARVAAWLLLIFPYHLFNVIGYDPEIPGTFLFVAGVWLALGAFEKQPAALPWLLLRGVALGASLFLASIQRGGVDLLLFTDLLVFVALQALRRGSLLSLRPALIVLSAAFLVWWPAKSNAESWIHSHDFYQHSSHQLGFLVRGWSLPNLGEYLHRYEQLDFASAREDKKRVLLSVLATEAVREPAVTLGLVPVVKTGKFFLLGYTAKTEPALTPGGYGTAARCAKALQVAYAPFLLFLCITGLVAVLKNNALAWRLALPLLAIVSAASAIVLTGETSPRYSHCIHFALVGAAAVGFCKLRRGVRPALSMDAGRIKQFILFVAAAGLLWIGFATALSAGLRGSSSYLFSDTRRAVVTLAGRPLPLEPLNRWTTPWEESVDIGEGFALPAKLRIEWPAANHPQHRDWNMSVWLPAGASEPWASCRIVMPGADHHDAFYQLRELDGMKRAAWTDVSPDNGRDSVEIDLLPPPGQPGFRPTGSITLAFGYIQPVLVRAQ